MSERPDLEALGAELQRQLRLQDWRVTYLYVPDLTDASGNAVYGLCDRLVDNKTATIAIRDPLASRPLPAGVEDKPVEAVLIHELVHLHMAPLAVNTPQGIAAEEQAVWPIADEIARLRGTARGEMIARAMAVRGGQPIAGAIKENQMSMKKALAMLKAAMDADGVKEDSGTAKALAALMAEDEKPGEPDGDEAKKAAAARAAETEPKKEEPKEARAADCPPKAAAMTIADVDQRAAAVASKIFGEHTERAALIAANAKHFNAAEQGWLAAQPLPTVKSLVAARLTGPSAQPQEQRAARVGIGPLGAMPTDPLDGVPSADRLDTAAALKNIARRFGIDTEKRPAIEIDSRGMSLSNVGNIRDQIDEMVRSGQMAARQGRT